MNQNKYLLFISVLGICYSKEKLSSKMQISDSKSISKEPLCSGSVSVRVEGKIRASTRVAEQHHVRGVKDYEGGSLALHLVYAFPWTGGLRRKLGNHMIQIPVSVARTLCLFQGHTDGPRLAQVEPRSANCQAIFPLQQAAQVARSCDSVCGSLRVKLGVYKCKWESSFSLNRPFKDPNTPGLIYYINPMYFSNDSVSTGPVTLQVT